jgi:hypothetical protein
MTGAGFTAGSFDRGGSVRDIQGRVHAYETGKIGASVRMLDLSAMPGPRLYTALVARGFVHRRCPLVAHRGRRGETYWRRTDGTTTADARDPAIVPMDVYVHPDGGFVRVFPAGDAPSAYAGILLRPPRAREDIFTRKMELEFDPSFANEACRVSPRGNAIPRGPRHAHGLRYDPTRKLESLMFAREVLSSARVAMPAYADEEAAS